MLKFTATLFSILALILLASGNGLACDCNTLSRSESFNVSDSVFSGRVVRVEDSGANRLFTFKVEQSLKGDNAGEAVISSGLTNCDYDFNLDGNYVVYARRSEGRLRASICLSTAALPVSKEPGKDSGSTPTQLSSKPHSNFWQVASVTGVSVSLSLMVGFLVKRFWRRAA
jgi:hypothetical protein